MDARHQDVGGIVLAAHDRPLVLVAVLGTVQYACHPSV